MDDALIEFVRLCDLAIEEADKLVREFRAQGAVEELQRLAQLALENLTALKASASAAGGRIHRPSNGAGCGLTRAVGWLTGIVWGQRNPAVFPTPAARGSGLVQRLLGGNDLWTAWKITIA